jgi:hypothetical protein
VEGEEAKEDEFEENVDFFETRVQQIVGILTHVLPSVCKETSLISKV